MKSTIKLITLFFSLSIGKVSAQTFEPSAGITTEVLEMNPQSGPHNYFGIKVTIPRTYAEDITIVGSFGEIETTVLPYTLTITAGQTSAETSVSFLEIGPASYPNVITITSTTPLAVTHSGAKYLTYLAYMDPPLTVSVGTDTGITRILNEFYDSLAIDASVLTTTLKLPSTISKSNIDFTNLAAAHLTDNDSLEIIAAPFYGNNEDSSCFFTIYQNTYTHKYSFPRMIKLVSNSYGRVLDMETGRITTFSDYGNEYSSSVSNSSGLFLTTNKYHDCLAAAGDCIDSYFSFKKATILKIVAGVVANKFSAWTLGIVATYCIGKECGPYSMSMERAVINHFLH